MDKEKSIAQVFANNLTRFRNQRGLSQYDLSNNTGISRTMISHYEREGVIPPADRLQALADTLGIAVSKLFEPHGEPLCPLPADLTHIDPRSVKKLQDILSLPTEDRNDLYRILNKMLRKNQLEQQAKVAHISNPGGPA